MLIKHITVILTFVMIICTSFAADTVAPGVNDNCDYDTLGSYSEPVSLTAKYEPNTFTLNYYNGDTRIDGITDPEMTQCIYDDKIAALPPAPYKPGYEFRGWRVRCNLSNYYTNEEIPYNSEYIRWEPISSTGRTMNSVYGNGITSGGLNPGEWGVKFSAGELRGRAICSGLGDDWNSPSYHWEGNGSDWMTTEDEIVSAGDGQSCWCVATDFGDNCHIGAPFGVFLVNATRPDSGVEVGCTYECAYFCAMFVATNWGERFRELIFGIND